MRFSSSTVRIDAVAFDLGITADIAYAVAGEVLEVGFVGGSSLVPNLHERRFDGSLRRSSSVESVGGQ